MARHLFWSALSVALASCAASTLPPLESTHPASPQADEAPAFGGPSVLAQPGDLRADGPAASRGAATIYTCPMHPEVRRSHPGQCPKCGMTLSPADEGRPLPQGHAQ